MRASVSACKSDFLNQPMRPYFSVFSPNTGKYGPEITPYLDTFHAVNSSMIIFICCI